MLAIMLLAVVAPRPMVLVHYMPWFEAKPKSAQMGWHWTMGVHDGEKQLASHYRPARGAYDSGDRAVVKLKSAK